MNEPLLDIAERARVADLYARFVYQAPRWPVDPPKSEPEPSIPPEVAARPVNLAAEAISPSSGPTIAQVQRAFLGQLRVAGYRVRGAEYTMAQMLSAQRDRAHGAPRHVCIHLVRVIVGCSFPTIGKAFRKDHTSCVYAMDRAPYWITVDPQIAEAYRATLEMFKERA